MRASRLVQLIAGAALALIGLPVLLAGLVLGWLHVAERDDDGFFTTGTEQVTTPARALLSEDVDLGASPTEDDWVPFDGDLATVRLRVDGPEGLFVGVGPTDDVAAYLAGVDRAVIRDGLFVPGDVELDRSTGEVEPGPPAAETFWAATGTHELTWDVERGRWTVVVMRADGGAGVDAALQAGVRIQWLLAVAAVLTMVGAGLLGGGVWAAVAASRAAGREPAAAGARRAYPVRLDGHLDEPLSRWLWLVKWFLALPHVVVLVGLWIAFAVTTAMAWFAILVTGRYPRALFDFGIGVMRWTWRVGFYAFSAIGTDRYPPFSLAPDPAYPADLHVDAPEQLSRGLVLVKTWLLAIPHYLVVALLTGGFGLRVSGIVTALVVVAGVVLLVSGAYPRPLFDVTMGCNRWTYRVLAYAALMTDEYPPFRFDAGGTDPATPPAVPPVEPAPATAQELVPS